MSDHVRRFTAPMLFVALLISPAIADACRCVSRTPAALARAADAIVLADVIGINDRDAGARTYTLRLIKSWKTHLAGQIPVRSEATTCRAELAVGGRYLVYLKSAAGKYRTDACSGNLPAHRAASVMKTLGRPRGWKRRMEKEAIISRPDHVGRREVQVEPEDLPRILG